MQPKKGIGIMIALKPKAGPPALDTPGKSGIGQRNDMQESPADEPAEDQGSVAPTPESVNYRTDQETCGNCEYMQGSDCSFLQQPVSEGDSCNRFEAKAQDQSQDQGGMAAQQPAAGGFGGGESSRY